MVKKKSLKLLLVVLYFNEFVPPTEVGYINDLLTKKSLRDIIGKYLKASGTAATAKFPG